MIPSQRPDPIARVAAQAAAAAAAAAAAVPAPAAEPITAQTQMLRKPRLLVAGEFSAGKTRLISGLLGEAVLPSNVTSTALPPVWLVHGEAPKLAVPLDGATREIDGVSDLDVETTRYGILAHPAPILDSFEIIDTPGNSDPNIPAETWQRMVDYADAVVWCTNATQAWRQSEKSVWQEMPEALRGSATLLITHADRMADQRSADRVLRRVQREAGDFFAHFMLVSLLSASDITRISAHLQGVADGLQIRPGADNATVAITAEKARLNLQARTPAPRAQRPEPEPLPGKTPPTPATAAQAPMGRARAVWQQIGQGCETASPAEILERVERLIGILDALDAPGLSAAQSAKPAPAARPPAPAAAADDDFDEMDNIFDTPALDIDSGSGRAAPAAPARHNP